MSSAKAADKTTDKKVSTSGARASQADTREALLLAAKKVFAAKGFEGATVKDLADAAGVNISLVSYHFGGKEGLYRTALEGFGFERVEAAERVLRGSTSKEDFRVRLKLFAEDFIDIHFRDNETCRMIHRGMDSLDTTTLELFKNVFVRIFDAFHSFITSAQKSGLLKEELDPEIIASVMFGSLMHVVKSAPIAKAVGRRSIEDVEYRDSVIDHWVSIHTEGIFKS